MKEELIQLRNHHLKQGKNNDRTPIYPIVKPEGIKGLEEYLSNHSIGGGVTKVDSLPEQGEQGKIYYNTTDNKYYTYNGTGYNELGSAAMKVVANHTPTRLGQYVIQPDVLYNAGSMAMSSRKVSGDTIYALGINLADASVDVASCYVFRQTMPAGGSKYNIRIEYPLGSGVSLVIPDAAREILENLEGGHTYEFNILHGVLMVADITDTSE